MLGTGLQLDEEDMITTNRRKSGGGRIKEGVRGGRERWEPYDVCDKDQDRKVYFLLLFTITASVLPYFATFL